MRVHVTNPQLIPDLNPHSPELQRCAVANYNQLDISRSEACHVCPRGDRTKMPNRHTAVEQRACHFGSERFMVTEDRVAAMAVHVETGKHADGPSSWGRAVLRRDRAAVGWSSWTAGRAGQGPRNSSKAWEAARLPDDSGGFRMCGEVVT